MADAGRVIAGTARGIRLAAPGAATRPLADRVKQTLFAILEPDLPGASVLDLFAGSGAAGIEALSRGAAHATFVERDARRVRGHRGEPRADAPGGRARAIVRARRARLARGPDAAAAGPFDIVIARPAVRRDRSCSTPPWPPSDRSSRPGARVVAKHFWRDAPPAPIGLLASERERRFGETALTFYRRQEDR